MSICDYRRHPRSTALNKGEEEACPMAKFTVGEFALKPNGAMRELFSG
jgi:hypothetical protein